ncbi:MAG TPA: response regulator [Rhizomicrobium sp.]|nr:response regulator [Rhizomicrobium sp.]
MKTCLVVDDSRVIRKVACRILRELSFETTEAENGAAALMSCRQKMPDLILLDWHMPQITGIEFLRSLRSETRGNHPVVVLCTTENDSARIGEALNAGADEFVVKPFDRDILRAKLAEVGLVQPQ